VGLTLGREHPARLFLGGLAVTLGNPKVMVFYLALLPTLLDVARVDAIAYAELVGVTLGVLGAVFAAYVALAARARRLFASPRVIRAVNRGTGAVMAGGGRGDRGAVRVSGKEAPATGTRIACVSGRKFFTHTRPNQLAGQPWLFRSTAVASHD
jgi:hypothetical protein